MVKSRAVHAPYELKWPMPEIMQRPRMHLRPVLRKLLFCRHNSIRQQLQDVLARHADVRLLPSACANYGWRFDALRSKVVPQALEDGSSQQAIVRNGAVFDLGVDVGLNPRRLRFLNWD